MPDASAHPWWRRLGPRHLLLLLPWIGLVIGSAKPIEDNSLLWHIRAGTLQLDLGRVLTTDPFSFTMQGAPWRTQSWLAELGYGVLERATGGLGWVPVLLVVVGSLVFLLVGTEVWRMSRSLWGTGLVLAGLTWMALAFEVPRPVLFSYLFLALLVVMLNRRMAWAVPLLLWVWASVHGSWVVGFGYVFLDALAHRRSWRQTAKVLVASSLTVSLTAHGVWGWWIVLDFFRNRDALRLMSEWRIPDLLSVPVIPFTIGVVAILYAAARKRLPAAALWVVAPFLIFGLTAGRSLMPAAIVLAPFTVGHIGTAAVRVDQSRREALLNMGIAVLLLLAPLGAFAVFHPTLDASRFPIEAVEHLAAGRVWHDDATGGYLIYAYWPEREVYVDDRAELYGYEGMLEFIQSREGAPVWQDVFGRYGISQALVHEDSGLGRVLDQEGWSEAYKGEHWSVWTDPTR